jgi:hypothetical protein
MLQFAAWSPDLPSYANPGATVASNVRPNFTSYGPFPDLGNAAASAISARARGAISVTGSDGEVATFVGDATKLYKLSAGTFSDVSVGGGYSLSEEEGWEFAVFNNKVIGASITENLQSWTLGSSTAFAALAVSTLKPKGRHIAAVLRFVVLGNTEESGTSYPSRIRWSAIDDETSYDQSASTLSDYQDIQDGGWVQKVVSGGDYGLVICERAIYRMDFIGAPEVFQFTLVEKNRGTIAPGSVVSWGRLTFFLDADGFYQFDGAGSTGISHGKVSKWFQDNENADVRHLMSATIDPVRSIVMWSFASSSSATPDTLLLYHWPSGKWSTASASVELIFRALSGGYDLDTTAPGETDDLDSTASALDLLSLDSRFWQGGVGLLAAFDTSHQLKYFDGSNLAATIETGRVQIFAKTGERALATGFRPLVDGGTLTGQIAGTERLNDTETFGSVGTQEVDGLIPDLVSARYHNFRVLVAAGGTWTHAQGVQPEAQPDGMF